MIMQTIMFVTGWFIVSVAFCLIFGKIILEEEEKKDDLN